MTNLSVNVFVEADNQLNAHRIENGLPGIQLVCFSTAHHTSAHAKTVRIVRCHEECPSKKNRPGSKYELVFIHEKMLNSDVNGEQK